LLTILLIQPHERLFEETEEKLAMKSEMMVILKMGMAEILHVILMEHLYVQEEAIALQTYARPAILIMSQTQLIQNV